MNLSYLLNPLEASKDNKDPSQSGSASASASTKDHISSSTTDIHPRNNRDKASSTVDSETDLTANRAQFKNKGRNVQSLTDGDLTDNRRSCHSDSFDLAPLGLVQEGAAQTPPPPHSSSNRDSLALPKTPLLWDDHERGKESVGVKRKQYRSAKPPRVPITVDGVGSDSNSNSYDYSGKSGGSGSSSTSNSTGMADIRRRGDSFKRGKKSPEPKDADVDSALQPDLERTADGKFRCNWPRCGKEFSVAARLSTHFRIHLGKPPYLCGYKGCEKAFHTSSSLSHHRVVHTDQSLRPYVCRHDRCGATYTQLARLITHQRTTHSGSILFISPEAAASTSSSPTSPLFSSLPPTSASIYATAGDRPAREFPFHLSRTHSDSYPQDGRARRAESDYPDENVNEMRLRAEAALTMASFSTMATIRDASSPWSSSEETPPRARVGPTDYHPHSAPYDNRSYYPQGPSQPTSPDEHQQQPHPPGWFSNQPPARSGHGYHRHSQGTSPLYEGDSPKNDRRRYYQGYSPQAQPVSPDQDRKYQRGWSTQHSPSDNSEEYYRLERGYFDSLYPSEGFSPPQEPPHDKESSPDSPQ
ncbi:hypothetical protein EMPS_11307 [Entomortierella parvispora]|uniref:C2H2-type domain-containing protein n=1 Tax=Entomortierella parvispora TaxID=205924 RepID=A0A9P3HMC7_9FUNG|nr:hypothetical protein EMPS_11307 [Entomortierella parvispora]